MIDFNSNESLNIVTGTTGMSSENGTASLQGKNLKKYTTYKLRAECAADAQAVRAVLLPWLMYWQETRNNMVFEGVLHAMPDVTVEFSITAEGPSREEMLWLLAGIDNCHVASDTLELIESYTGERASPQTSEESAKLPAINLLRQALAAVRVRQRVLGLELERTLQILRTYDIASRFGAQFQPAQDEDRPGWVVPEKNESSGLTALRRICPPINCKTWQMQGNKIIKARLAVINA